MDGQAALLCISDFFGAAPDDEQMQRLTGADAYALGWIAKGAIPRAGLLEHLVTLAEFCELLSTTLTGMTGRETARAGNMAEWLRAGRVDTESGPRPARDLAEPRVAASALACLRRVNGQ